jgi:hypothetical protein
MTLQELERAVRDLSMEEQFSLLETIVQVIKAKQQPRIDRQVLVNELQGCLKHPGQSPPTDDEIEAMREERLLEKYLK